MNHRRWALYAGASGVAVSIVLILLSLPWQPRRPAAAALVRQLAETGAPASTPPVPVPPPPPYVPPEVVAAVYATSNTALSPERFGSILSLLKDTELNAVVINVNDSSTALVDKPELSTLVQSLNQSGVHTIARIIAFQNEPLVAAHPEWALETSGGAVWHDRGGHHWLDPASRALWQNLLTLSERAAALGFRELNYDYIRFPSDGAVANAVYPAYTGDRPKAAVINEFAAFLHDNLKRQYPHVLLSADIFAHSILVNDDTHIGQRFIDIVDHFDAIAPMAYPSHYRSGNFGFKNPAAHPYEVVYGTLSLAKEKLKAAGKPRVVLRPWLQDFNLGALYTPAMVKQEMKAVTDAGFTNGWMLWNPRNRYSVGALALEKSIAADTQKQ